MFLCTTVMKDLGHSGFFPLADSYDQGVKRNFAQVNCVHAYLHVGLTVEIQSQSL